MINERELLRYIEKQPGHAAGFKQIAHDLGLKGQARKALDDLLREMTRRRKLFPLGKERWSLPTARQDLVAGSLRMHRDGFGFVTPEPDSLPANAQGKVQGDIFIAPPHIGDAMHGDRVWVELGRIQADGKAEGRILRVAERRQETVVGTFHYGSRYNYLDPIDEKVAMQIIIPEGMEYPAEKKGEEGQGDSSADHGLDGTQPRADRRRAANPDRVLGEEAHQTRWDDLENVVVEAEIIQWPSPTQNPRGRVIEILGYEDDFGVDVEIIIRKYHLPHVFPDDVLRQAREADAAIPARVLASRRDFRGQPIVTVDPESARDFDDAVVARRKENGNYELQVHIADVAHYVEDGSPIDREARKRGTSVYFPDRAVPMLPLELSTDICSLRPGLDRLVMSCVMEVDPRGEIVEYELAEGVIHSVQRMTYTEVHAILEGDEEQRRRHAELVPSVELMRELAEILNRRRMRRGSIDFDLPEPVIKFDELGLMKGILRSERNWAHRLIEEFMLAANETVAGHLEKCGVASLYRIHEEPDPAKVYDFENAAAAFGYSLGIGALPVKRMRMRADQRAARQGGRRPAPALELPQNARVTPRMYQKLAQKIAGKPEERILSRLMLRSLKQARYSEKNEGHFALASPAYTHFTSPIRRYPDLVIHRLLKAVLRDQFLRDEAGGGATPGNTIVSWPEPQRAGRQDHKGRQKLQEDPIPEIELQEIAFQSSQTERAAEEAERELLEWKKLKFMQDRVGQDFDGLIVSVTRFGFFVELEELFIEGLVPLDSLEGDRYTFRENTRQIIGDKTKTTYSVGDKIRVLVDRIDRMQRKIQLAVPQEPPTPARKSGRRGRGGLPVR